MLVAMRTGATGLPYRVAELTDKRIFRHYAIFDRSHRRSVWVGNAWGFNAAEALREFRAECQGKTD